MWVVRDFALQLREGGFYFPFSFPPFNISPSFFFFLFSFFLFLLSLIEWLLLAHIIIGNKITPKQYLENALKLQGGAAGGAQKKNQIRSMITTFFQERDCVTLPKPATGSVYNLFTLKPFSKQILY